MHLQTVRDVVTWYLAAPAVQPIQKDRRRVLLALAAAIGDKPIADCSSTDLFDFLKRSPAAETQRVNSYRIRPVFRAAFTAGLAASDPFARAIVPRRERSPGVIDADFRALLRAAKPQLRRVLVFMRFAGIRPGQLRQLRWSDINLQGNCIELRKRAGRQREDRPIWHCLNRVTAKLLAWIRRQAARSPFIFLNGWRLPWTCRYLDRQFRELRKKARTPPRTLLWGDHPGPSATVDKEATVMLADLMKPAGRPQTLFWEPSIGTTLDGRASTTQTTRHETPRPRMWTASQRRLARNSANAPPGAPRGR